MLTIRDQQMKSMSEQSPGQSMIVPCKPDWIEFRLQDSDGNPVPDIKYRIQLPDSSFREGAFDQEGKVRLESILSGQCRLTLPDVDGKEWTPV